MLIERDNSNLYLELQPGYAGTTNERMIAPGMQAGYTEDGDLAFIEVFGNEAGLEMESLDRLLVRGVSEVKIEPSPPSD